jgi:hypothetical protein
MALRLGRMGEKMTTAKSAKIRYEAVRLKGEAGFQSQIDEVILRRRGREVSHFEEGKELI